MVRHKKGRLFVRRRTSNVAMLIGEWKIDQYDFNQISQNFELCQCPGNFLGRSCMSLANVHGMGL